MTIGIAKRGLAENPIPVEAKAEAPLCIVGEENTAQIVLADSPTRTEKEAAEKLAYYIHEATGKTLSIIHQSDLPSEDSGGKVSIFIGDQEANAKMGLSSGKLDEETFAIKTGVNAIHLVGKDTFYTFNVGLTPQGRSPATIWAINYLAEHYIGVRWLWPGKLGTYIPEIREISIPHLDMEQRPPLSLRAFHTTLRPFKASPLFPADEIEQEHADAFAWMENQQLGDRFRATIGHSFTNWWDKYSATQPDLFAKPPQGLKQLSSRGVKLRLANPAVIETIAREYTEAGCPDYWSIAPNDGVGFDTSAETCAWDVPKGQKPLDIWNGKGELTARYVTFWNRVYERLSKLNPRITMGTFAYSSYRNPPPKEVQVKARLVVAVVPAYSTDLWEKWSAAGAKMILRPNWWQAGVDAPYLPLRREGEFIRFAAQHGMIGFNADSLIGFWGAQGLRYYVTARLLQRPERTIDSIVDEYASAFGKAKPAILEYFKYWEDFSTRAAYPVAAGGAVSIDPAGTYEKLGREKGLALHPIPGSYEILPFLYTDEVIAKAQSILDRALKLTETEKDKSFGKRVEFLSSGLAELRSLRDVMIAYNAFKKANTESSRKKYATACDDLLKLRQTLTKEGEFWGDVVYSREIRRKIPTLPSSMGAGGDTNYDGL